jgi:hypothetical protein
LVDQAGLHRVDDRLLEALARNGMSASGTRRRWDGAKGRHG